MRILAKDLSSHLNRSFSNFYFIFGEEPLQHQEAIDLLRQEAYKQAYTEREILSLSSRTTWDDLLQNLNAQSLFGSKRLIEYSLEDKISKEMAGLLDKLGSFSFPPDIMILLIASKIDFKQQQSHWFTQLERLGCTVLARPLSYEETLQWLRKRFSLAGFQATPEAIHLLWERTEGNLLAAAQSLEKLALYHNLSSKSLLTDSKTTITIEDIQAISGMDARFTLYDLIDAALSGSSARTSQIFYSLKNEGIDPILINWAIAKEVRTSIILVEKWKKGAHLSALFREHGVWKRREPLIQNFIQRISLDKLQQILKQSHTVDNAIKGRSMTNAWDLLLTLCLLLTGAYNG